MGKIDNVNIEGNDFKVLSRLPYRVECKLEEELLSMMEDVDPNINLEEIDFEDQNQVIKFAKGFKIAKKHAINDFLIVTCVKFPPITNRELDDPEHEFTDSFRELGDYLFEKYVQLYSKKMESKKKLTD